MGRQAYLNRLALGRSPYEPPDESSVDPSGPVRRVSNIHADDYMQQYDSRGHPVNPESKILGRELRRAKNDILSTMGIVVSGEDRNANLTNEEEKLTQIAAENDFGLVMTTLDQVFVFFGTWWSSSLTGRIQTYKRYTHAALLDVIRSERGSTGVLGFYTAGIPAWALSSALAFARDNPLKRLFITMQGFCLDLTGNATISLGIRSLFGLTYWVARNSVLLLSVEAYMYSLLQTISLVPSNSLPSVRQMIPFGEGSLFQLPPLPTDLSLPSLGAFVARLMTSPGILTFVYAFYLRPQLEERIYHLVRRQLPKPTLADELSIRVAYDENLIDWVVPTLGRKSEEETRRAKLTLLQDIKCEFGKLYEWVFSLFGLLSARNPDSQAVEGFNRERIQNLRNSIESLQHELEEVQLRNNPAGVEIDGPLAQPLGETAPVQAVDVTQPGLPAVSEAAHLGDPDMALGMNQVLTNENRMSQSPGEMSNEYFSDMATLGRTTARSAASNSQSQARQTQRGDSMPRPRQNSRSNTLASRPSSPETSPPNSPRVRASLIHQSSDIITMQLELLSNRSRNAQARTAITGAQIPRLGHEGLRSHSGAVDRRSIAEFLEALILSQAQHQASQQPALEDPDDLSNITVGVSQAIRQDVDTPENENPDLPQMGAARDHHEPIEEPPSSRIPNILPDGVEEPSDEDHTFQPPPALDAIQNSDTQTDTEVLPPFHRQPVTDQSSIAHRVTLLSAHPVDSLASHVAAVVSNIILAPLESLCMRSLAHSYLAMDPSSVVALSDLHPIGLWFGGSSWPDAFAYTARLVLMRGMQAALRAGVWGFLVGSTMRIGQKFCGWGTL